MTFSVEQNAAMIAWVHNFRRWTWCTFTIGFAAAVWGLWSGERWLVGSGLAAMIGVAVLIAVRRWRRRGCRPAMPAASLSVERGPPGNQQRSAIRHGLPPRRPFRPKAA